MIALAAVALLLSAGSANADKISLASPGFSTVKIDPKLGSFYADHFAQQLVLHGGLSVITQSEIQSLLGFERQKQLLGCADDSNSCIAELAGALGVDALITGNVGRVGKRFVINIKIVASRDSRALSVQSGQVTDEDALLDFLNEAAGRSAADVKRELGKQKAPDVVVESAPLKPPAAVETPLAPPPEVTVGVERRGFTGPALVSGIAGGALLVGGGVFLGLAANSHRQLAEGTEIIPDLDRHTQQGRMFNTLGLVGVGVGAAGLGLAAVLALTTSEPAPVNAAVVPIQGGAVAVFEGALSW